MIRFANHGIFHRKVKEKNKYEAFVNTTDLEITTSN